MSELGLIGLNDDKIKKMKYEDLTMIKLEDVHLAQAMIGFIRKLKSFNLQILRILIQTNE